MTLDEYRAELEKLLEETRQTFTIDAGTPMTPQRAILIAHAHRKEGLTLEEMREVDAMTSQYDLAYRFAELLKAIDAVGA